VPLGRDVARGQRRLGAFLFTLGRAGMDAVLAFVQQPEQSGSLDE